MQSPMKSLITAMIAGFAFSTPYGPAAAATLIYDATLSGATEIPPTGSPGTGFATVTINTVADTMRVQESFSGLETAMSTGTTASHIHCCAVQPANVGIATAVPTFPGFPLGVFSGTYDMTFDMTSAASYNPAFITLEGGTVTAAFAALLAGLNDGQAYINVHSSLFPTGEIRGILELTPLPGALPLAATGFGLLGLLGWRRKRKSTTSVLAA
jgi:hypothetical protein